MKESGAPGQGHRGAVGGEEGGRVEGWGEGGGRLQKGRQTTTALCLWPTDTHHTEGINTEF